MRHHLEKTPLEKKNARATHASLRLIGWPVKRDMKVADSPIPKRVAGIQAFLQPVRAKGSSPRRKPWDQ